jgi:hypothetical protein
MKLVCSQLKLKRFFPVFLALCLLSFAFAAAAQKRFSKTYPASSKVRLQLTNRSGTITVSGWERKEVRLSASLEEPAAKIVPSASDDSLVINVVRDNYGRGDVGSVNFEVKIPFGSIVDIETKIGNLTVRDISGEMVSANVTSEGDITLSGISAASVMAANVTGDIFFDGEMQAGGTYRFSTTGGNINLRVPFDSSFRMVATAPATGRIDLGAFGNNGLNFVNTGRRIVGNINGGASSLTLTSQRGSISFIRR